MPDDKQKPGFLSRLFRRGTPVEEEEKGTQERTEPGGPVADSPAAEDTAAPNVPAEALDPIAQTESFESLPPALPVEPPTAPARSWWNRLRDGLSRSSSAIGKGITDIFTKRKLDATTIEELEDVLIQADLGIDVATRITAAVGKGRFDR